MLVIIAVFLFIWHLSIWLLSKGVIFVAKELFAVDWTGKFWAVYIGLVAIWYALSLFFIDDHARV